MTHLAEIVRLSERNNAKLLITGDHLQLAAMESGGGMSLLAGYLGHTQLAVPVRFTAEWEQRASLRLREGDKSALEAYDEHAPDHRRRPGSSIRGGPPRLRRRPARRRASASDGLHPGGLPRAEPDHPRRPDPPRPRRS